MLAYALPQESRDAGTVENHDSGVRQVVRTLVGVGPATPTDHDDLGSPGLRTVGASSLDGPTSPPDVEYFEAPGGGRSFLSTELGMLDAYLNQVKRRDVPLTLASARRR